MAFTTQLMLCILLFSLKMLQLVCPVWPRTVPIHLPLPVHSLNDGELELHFHTGPQQYVDYSADGGCWTLYWRSCLDIKEYFTWRYSIPK